MLTLTCPYCAVPFHADHAAFIHTAFSRDDSTTTCKDESVILVAVSCLTCLKGSIWKCPYLHLEIAQGAPPEACRQIFARYLKHEKIELLYPKYVVPKLLAMSPVLIPEKYKQDYLEAYQTWFVSEQASAAISRRLLQHIIREQLGIEERNLNLEVQALRRSNMLPISLMADIDAIREVGNFAAHPKKDTNTGEVLPVEADEALWTFQTVEKLLEHYFMDIPLSERRRAELALKVERTRGGKE